MRLGINPTGAQVIGEPDLCRLTMRFNAKPAEPFQDRVHERVLHPSIRKTGTYPAALTRSKNAIRDIITDPAKGLHLIRSFRSNLYRYSAALWRCAKISASRTSGVSRHCFTVHQNPASADTLTWF